ncbi:hypothetical protein PIB30_047142 [Stylosanthes scabra]|uniref:Uncharacterized protein n=1 Tax=Stylosanthes scabra TaxID=79078 RepID=A0ABU6VEL8_9FABA|nr:hypothetical protein [Stylosanthes scabra]
MRRFAFILGISSHSRCQLDGFEQRKFPLVERWAGYSMSRDSKEPRVRTWRWILNSVGTHDVKWTPYADPELQNLVPSFVTESEEFVVLCNR